MFYFKAREGIPYSLELKAKFSYLLILYYFSKQQGGNTLLNSWHFFYKFGVLIAFKNILNKLNDNVFVLKSKI